MFCPNNVDSLPEFMSTNCPNWGGQLPPPAPPRPVRLWPKPYGSGVQRLSLAAWRQAQSSKTASTSVQISKWLYCRRTRHYNIVADPRNRLEYTEFVERRKTTTFVVVRMSLMNFAGKNGFREMHKCILLFDATTGERPPPLPNRFGGGGFRSQNWRDGWEGGTDRREGGRDVMAIMKLTQCIWHGMGA